MGKVRNYEIYGLVRRLRRFKFEAAKAVSADLSDVNTHDITRAKSYLTAVTTYLDWVVAQPELDLPASHPQEYELPPESDLNMPENESTVDFLHMFKILETEIVNSQSARKQAGIISHDERRVRDILLKMNNFITQYIEPTKPLDLPESSPLRETVGDGRLGV